MYLAPLTLLAISFSQPPMRPAHDGFMPYAEEWHAALVDARKLGPAAAYTRYVTLHGIAKVADHLTYRKVGDFWLNSTSREPEFAKLRFVTPTLLALNVFDYGPVWPVVWERFAEVDPFLHVQLTFTVGTVGRKYFPAERGSKAGWYDAKFLGTRTVPALIPYLPKDEAAELVALTQSAAPLLRLDWLLDQITIQAGRKGTGYFDVLGVKNRDDFDKLVGLNKAESQRIKREVAAIVARSGVAQFPRQIFRFQALTGGYWQTRDRITDNRDAGNALRQLDGDYKHEAEEIYGPLSNGLYAFFLCNDQGVRQDSAPDGVGPDKTAPGNDGRIHPASCAACHSDGLRAIDDWGRKVYTSGLSLNSPDYEKSRRLSQLYVADLKEWIDGDREYYAKRVMRLTGWKLEELSKAVIRSREYSVRDIDTTQAAYELGVSVETYTAKLKAYVQANPLSDAVLASHLTGVTIRADDWEQVQPIVQEIIFGSPSK